MSHKRTAGGTAAATTSLSKEAQLKTRLWGTHRQHLVSSFASKRACSRCQCV
ncbi:MAG: hypothetical protein ACKESB_02195 [Candidatus Hodgkinia cicadicola]